jgi:lactoylglutathione lyase|tara:strand:- start:579 stop:1019 length:441 start_codon:yes stop_codon:yes gene_type:complete
MEYLHTMVRVNNIDESINFYCNKLGLFEYSRKDYEKGRFTLVFLCAPEDKELASNSQKPLLELTYNWDLEEYKGGRNFGHLAFSVNNIYEKCQSLMDNGVTINRPPRDGYMAFIKSPDGISIELLQKNKPLEIIEPWNNMKNIGTW